MKNRVELISGRSQLKYHLVRRSQNVMKSKTIVLCGQDDVLSSYVEHFLTSQKGWRVVNISIEKGPDALIQLVDKIHPNIVILQLGNRSSNSNVPAALLQHQPRLKVLTLSLNDNRLEVYSRQDILIKSSDDLISAIEADSVCPTNNTNTEEEFNLEGGD
jgi:hypothetical protein